MGGTRKSARATQLTTTSEKRAKLDEKLANKDAVSNCQTMDIEDLVAADDEAVLKLRANLLEWYDCNHRVLPWRRNSFSKLPAGKAADGASSSLPLSTFIYHVWVSEVMSQQTQISRVMEYWRRWVDKWPTVQHLAQATEEEVNQMWSGLGYYRRARYLLEGARHVTGQLRGNMPTTCTELQTIPGIGAYTAAAISSIACGEQVAVIDANVIRVVSRLFRVEGDSRKSEVSKQISHLANHILDKQRPGCFNQAMMELGALICTGGVSTPQCDTCPINQQCGGYKAVREYVAQGGSLDAKDAPRVTNYPTKVEKNDKREEHLAVCVLEATTQLPKASGPKKRSRQKENEGEDNSGSSRYLLVKRPEKGLLAGLWQFPGLLVDADSTPEQRRSALDGYLEGAAKLPLRSAGVKVVQRQGVGSIVHIFSHLRMTIHITALTIQGMEDFPTTSVDDATADQPVTQWMTLEELNKFGLPSGFAKVWKLAKEHRAKQKTSIANYFKPK